MSADEKNFSCEKKEYSSTPHFLSQLKDIIHTPNENIKKEEKINNKELSESCENNTEQKENRTITTNNTKEIDNNINEEINKGISDENNQKENTNQNNLGVNINKKDGNIRDEKKEEKNEQIIENNKKDNNNKGKNNINSNNEEFKENISDKNNNIDNQNKNIKIEKNENKNIQEEKKNNKNNEKDLDRKDSNESKKSNKSQKEEKHKTCPSCLNNCFKWELKAEIRGKRAFPKNFKSKYNFSGESAFFKKLDFSILNTLHNSLNMAKWNISANNLQQINTKETLENIKTESNNKLNNMSSNKVPTSPLKDNSSQSVRELLNINYPIDNTKFNYSIIDANLCIKDNLKDLNNETKDNKDNKENTKEDGNKSQNNKDLRTIDDDCVEREIYFVLNGTFHGNKIFKNDLNFSVEYREFIKSAQFRLQNYQNKIIEMSKKMKGKKNIFQNMQTNFFGKVLTNINLGIEFSKPQSHEIIQTNFNSIVNSHIQLNKLLIELTIPNTFINNNKLNISNIFEIGNDDSNSISTKKTEISSPKKEENNNIMNNTQNNNFKNKNPYNIMFNSNISSPNTRTIGINRSIPASPHLNDFQKLIYQQKYSPLINNNLRNFSSNRDKSTTNILLSSAKYLFPSISIFNDDANAIYGKNDATTNVYYFTI